MALLDQVIPFHLPTCIARGRLVCVGPDLEKIIKQHNYPPLVNRFLSEMMALAIALASGFKYEGIFTLQANSSGPVRLMIVDVTQEGHVRAYARFEEAKMRALPLTASVFQVFGAGYLSFTIDLLKGSESDRYQGMVQMAGATLTDCVHHYFRQSEQVQTGVVVSSRLSHAIMEEDHYLASAIMLQRMPPLEPEEELALEDAWISALSFLGTVTPMELLSPSLNASILLRKLFWQEQIKIFPARLLVARCRCSEPKILEMLGHFNLEQVTEMIIDNKIEITCKFCGQVYEIFGQKLTDLLLLHKQ